MLPNWTDGLQTFGKWLEYFQMTEMHWLIFPWEKKKGNDCDLDTLLSPSEFYVHHVAAEAMCLRFTFVSQTHPHFFLSKWGPGTQKGSSISQAAVSLHSQSTITWSLPALWSFSPLVRHSCCCHVRVCHSWLCWAWYFHQTWVFLVWYLLYSWQVMWGIVSIKDKCKCFTGLMW